MATVTDALTYARAQSQTDSNGLTDANGLIWANEALVDFHRRLIDKGVDASQVQEAYRDGTLNQGTYLYPSDMFWLKSIELNYASTNPQDYVTATQVDVANLPNNASFSWLRKNAQTNQPYFDDHGDWFEIFPTPTGANNVSQLIRVFYFLAPKEFSTVNDTLVYPESLDYRLLAWRIAANYMYSLSKIQDGDAFMVKYEERVRQFTETLARGSQQPLEATPIQDDGWEY